MERTSRDKAPLCSDQEVRLEGRKHPDSDLVTFYVLMPDQLTADEKSVVHAHIETCTRCQNTVKHLEDNRARFTVDLLAEKQGKSL